MIRYGLKCAEGHEFDSWFRDSAAFDSLARAGQLACSVCGATSVEKRIMAPALSGAARKTDDGPEEGALTRAASPAEAALARLRRHLEKNSDYVGREFAAEARRMHVGEADERPIWGEATREDAESLRDEGIAVAPIPWMSRRDD